MTLFLSSIFFVPSFHPTRDGYALAGNNDLPSGAKPIPRMLTSRHSVAHYRAGTSPVPRLDGSSKHLKVVPWAND